MPFTFGPSWTSRGKGQSRLLPIQKPSFVMVWVTCTSVKVLLMLKGTYWFSDNICCHPDDVFHRCDNAKPYSAVKSKGEKNTLVNTLLSQLFWHASQASNSD